MKTKPFDLEAAKKGAKVVTRDGREVQELVFLETVTDGRPVIAVLYGVACSLTTEGRVDLDGSKHPSDLFLAVETKTVYVNLYPGDLHATGLEAQALAGVNAIAIAQPIEVEA